MGGPSTLGGSRTLTALRPLRSERSVTTVPPPTRVTLSPAPYKGRRRRKRCDRRKDCTTGETVAHDREWCKNIGLSRSRNSRRGKYRRFPCGPSCTFCHPALLNPRHDRDSERVERRESTQSPAVGDHVATEL